jgi:hypothetical protein
VPFVFDNSSIIGRSSQRSFYQIYYSSNSLGVDWTLLAGNIRVDIGTFDIDVSSIATASDYVFKVELVDDDNISEPVFIENVTINNMNYFLVDTVPPKGSIRIQNNTEYINTRDIIVNLEAYDETTAVKSYSINQEDVGANGTSGTSGFSNMTGVATWYIDGDDGVKLIQAVYKDYGDNIIPVGDDGNHFRTYKGITDQQVTAILYDGTDVWTAFNRGDNISVGIPQLYKNQSQITTLEGECTALASFNNTLYVAIKDDENKGILQRYAGGIVETVRDNATEYVDVAETTLNSLYIADSVINSMEVFDESLFLGLQNGTLLSFKGSVITARNETYLNTRSISKLATDGNLLYIYFDNSTEIMVMSKLSTGYYSFSVIDTGV